MLVIKGGIFDGVPRGTLLLWKQTRLDTQLESLEMQKYACNIDTTTCKIIAHKKPICC